MQRPHVSISLLVPTSGSDYLIGSPLTASTALRSSTGRSGRGKALVHWRRTTKLKVELVLALVAVLMAPGHPG